MSEAREMFIPEASEGEKIADTEQNRTSALEAAEQQEMDAMRLTGLSAEEAMEQREMDSFPDKEKLGEYRIFADTRPSGSRYDIFADGK